MIDATGIGELCLSPPVCHEQKKERGYKNESMAILPGGERLGL